MLQGLDVVSVLSLTLPAVLPSALADEDDEASFISIFHTFQKTAKFQGAFQLTTHELRGAGHSYGGTECHYQEVRLLTQPSHHNIAEKRSSGGHYQWLLTSA